MKIQYISFKFLLILVISGMTSMTYAQSNKEVAMKNLIESKHFVFKAQTALPTIGMAIQLSSTYDVRITPDSVIAYLPYYGRAYNIEYGSTDGGINFTSTKFDYNVKERKKGGWEITIIPKDTRDTRQIYMTLSGSGFGTIQVESNERQPISFNGFVVAR